MRAATFLLLVAASCAWGQADLEPAELIAQCSREADRRSVGLQSLEIECPGLEHALVELDFAPFLTEEQAAQLNIHALDDIAALSRHFAGRPASGPHLDRAALDSILEEIRREQDEPPRSWLELAREWLQGLLRRAEGEEDSWLRRWLEDFEASTVVTQTVAFGLLALVIVLAVAVVINELRAAGILRRRRRHSDGAARDAETAQGAGEPRPEDLWDAPLEERPALLLRLLIAALRRTGRLQADRSLTHRELTARAELEQTRQREAFRGVAMLAERMLYGAGGVPPAELGRVLEEGSALHAELCSPGGSRE